MQPLNFLILETKAHSICYQTQQDVIGLHTKNTSSYIFHNIWISKQMTTVTVNFNCKALCFQYPYKIKQRFNSMYWICCTAYLLVISTIPLLKTKTIKWQITATIILIHSYINIITTLVHDSFTHYPVSSR